ncbi:MAG: phage terminase large subunit [Candidatus Gastranaerophilales bacterium]|nr:phage terminase large subunit [Candidatus Gastranaerophilales bacterium]MCM1072286.1 phage terminase large subunit [Bacteroides sp.]
MNYDLLSAQQEFLNIPHNETLDVAIYQGGYGSGKTWCGSLLGLLLAYKYPGCRGLVGAKEYELVRKTTLVSYMEHLENFGFKAGKDYTYNKVDKIIRFSNGSEILFSALDDPEKFKSLNLHWAEIEEASQISDSSFKQLLGRLRNTQRGDDWVDFRYRLFGHTNPQPDKGWIWDRFVEHKLPNYRLILAPTTNNIYLPEHFIQSMKDSFDEEYYKINVLGEFGNYASGLVVKNFTQDNIKELHYQPDLPLHLTWDFNVDPMSCILAHKTDKKVFYFDEFVLENTTTQRTIEAIIAKYPNHKGDIIINGDASGDNRSTQSEASNYMIIKNALKNHGYNNVKFRLRSFNPPIKNRIAAFNAMVCNANGERRLFVDKRCQKFLQNMYNLKYKVGTSVVDVPTYAQIKSDNTLKFLEHPFDAGSYLVEYYFPIKFT